jgi:K+/H+ antiporter YhaU regulatory subunit KhtT
VNLGKDRGKQKLVIFREDDPKEVSEKFAQTHGLAPEKAFLLEKMLR